MPSAPTGLCRDCSSRAINGSRYCQRHQTNNNASIASILYDQYRADDPIRKLYRCPRWEKGTRLKVLRRDILCVDCGHRRATEADHIILARTVVEQFGVDEFYNPERCQGLCRSCHSAKTLKERQQRA
jgi:5-methylcytosine-specific restriction endonuclease McrA